MLEQSTQPGFETANPPTTQAAKPIATFDADAPEVKIGFTRQYKGKLFKVAHIFRSPTDDELFEYERRRNVRMRQADKSEIGEKGLAMSDDSESAAIWLWDKLIGRLEGYKDDPDWKSKVADSDKEYAITQGLLACDAFSVEPEFADDEELAGFDEDEKVANRIELAFYTGGQQVKFSHDLAEPTAQDQKDYKAAMKTSYTVRGTKLGKSDIRIPSKAKTLVKLYDRLIIEHDPRYVSRVPVHHKVAVVLEHFGEEKEVLQGN